MKTLHLVLKQKWFDMIASGEKLAEYRRMTDYWEKRICANRFDIEKVVFHRGYTNTTCEKYVKAISVDVGRKEWGADPMTEYYVIRLEGGWK